MKLLRFDEASVIALSRVSEAGMGFWIVTVSLNIVSEYVQVAVRDNGFALPIKEMEEIYSLHHLLEGQPVPKEEQHTTTMTKIVAVPGVLRVTLPGGYVAAYGAHQLLGSITLSTPTRFFRYTSSQADGRFSGTQLSQDTYLTTLNDHQFANSGFGAVGRYALPLPMPASHKHDYTLPAGTKLLVGTVAPQYGQAGGGVEVKTTSLVSGVKRNLQTLLPDF